VRIFSGYQHEGLVLRALRVLTRQTAGMSCLGSAAACALLLRKLAEQAGVLQLTCSTHHHLGLRQTPRRYRTAELFLRHPPPPAVKYGDEGLYRQLLAEQPLVKQQPLGLNSTTPSLARRFVEQQSRVMERLEVQERELMAAERARAQAAAAGAAHPASVQQEQMQLSPQQSASLREMAFNETQEALQAELQAAGCVHVACTPSHSSSWEAGQFCVHTAHIRGALHARPGNS
jgi:hypothetical protein